MYHNPHFSRTLSSGKTFFSSSKLIMRNSFVSLACESGEEILAWPDLIWHKVEDRLGRGYFMGHESTTYGPDLVIAG